MEVDFLQKFIKEQIEGTRPCEIKTLIYRDGGVELSPGNVAKAIIPEWLKDQTIEVSINCNGGQHKANIKSNYGDYTADITSTNPEHTGIDSHGLIIKIKGKLKDGDPVVVAKYSGLTKYIILCKAEVV